MYDETSEGGAKGSFENFRAEGDVLFKQRDFKKAIESYNTALELKPGDKNCLVSRAQCHLELGNPEKALADANETLEEDKNYIKGIYQKAEALYLKGSFEDALVYYHRGHKLRKEVHGFKLGIEKCQEAIQNSIGDKAGIKLENKGDLAFLQDEPQKGAKKQQKGGYSKPAAKREEKKKKRTRPADGQNKKTCKDLLGELYADKEYLENFLKEINKSERKTEHLEKCEDLAFDCLEYLDSRTEFWQQQEPMYARKRNKNMREKSASGTSKKDPTAWVLKNLEQIDDAQAKGKYNDSLKQSKMVMKEMEKWSDKDLPNRAELVANLYSLMGNAYLEKGNYEQALEHHKRDHEIAKQNNIGEAESRALDNLGRVYARMGKFEKAIQIWEEKLPMSKTALERTWLYHEIGRCHLEMQKYDLAGEYGEKSRTAAEEASDDTWAMNASILIAQSQVKKTEYQAALDSFEYALDLARKRDDKPAETAIKKAVEDINDKIVKSVKGDKSDTASQKSDTDRSEKGRDGTEGDDSQSATGRTETDTNKDPEQQSQHDDESHDTIGDAEEGSGSPRNEKNKKDKDSKDKEHDGDRVGDAEEGSSSNEKHTKDKDSNDKVLEWKIRVHTTKMSNAGTDADVLITLCGEKGTSEQIQLDNKDNNFESGKVDEFTKKLANVGKPTKLRIGHSNSGMASGWHLEKVEMESVQTKKIYTFNCGRWLADDEDDGSIVRELPAEGQDISTKLTEMKYKVVVHTGSKFGAGTDAHVFINLIGEEDESGDRPLTKSKTNKNKFEKGNEDEFELDALGIGKLKKIRIGHDGSSAGAGWYLDKVVITPASEQEILFECDRWLDSKEDDNLIVRELTAK